MGADRDGGMMAWCRDWLTDEHVLLMSPAAEGVYWRLLCHAWLEGSIPACSEHLARIARASHAEFVGIWAEVRDRWIEHPEKPGRLVNRRQERERAKADERRKVRQDKAKKAAAARWGKQCPRDARRNAPSMRQAVLGDAPQSNPHGVPPQPPQGGGMGAEPESGQVAAVAEVDQLLLGLDAVGYRSQVPIGKRRWVLGKEARRLARNGLTPALLEQLAELARQRGERADALLAHWLTNDLWREVVDEQALKDKEAGLRARQSRDHDRGPLLAGSLLPPPLRAAARS